MKQDKILAGGLVTVGPATSLKNCFLVSLLDKVLNQIQSLEFPSQAFYA